MVCLNGDFIRKESINHMPAGNAKFLMDSVFGLAQRMNQFRLSDAEIGLFCAVVIITAGKILYESLCLENLVASNCSTMSNQQEIHGDYQEHNLSGGT